MPKRKVGSSTGVLKEKLMRKLVRLSARPAPSKVKRKPKKTQERINLQITKGQAKGARKQSGGKWLTRKLKEDLPVEN